MRKKNKKEDKNSTHTQKKTKIVKNSYMGAMKSNKPKTSPIPWKKVKEGKEYNNQYPEKSRTKHKKMHGQ